MKKIIGILGVVAIAMALFFNSNTPNNENLDLASLIAMNTASAETYRALVNNCDRDDMTSFCQPSSGGITVGCEISWFWDDCYVTVHI